MPALDFVTLREQAAGMAQGVMAGDNLDLVIAAALLVAVVTMTLTSIWRTRRRAAVAAPATPSTAARIARLLTPAGLMKISAEHALAAARPRRKSGSHQTIRVSTPVSRVPQRALKAGADALTIARTSGLSRDGVAMMIAAAAPRTVAKAIVATSAATPTAPERPRSTTSAARAMSAPGAYTQSQRVIPPKGDRAAVGTYFSARLG
jgi:hypothetical protein